MWKVAGTLQICDDCALSSSYHSQMPQTLIFAFAILAGVALAVHQEIPAGEGHQSQDLAQELKRMQKLLFEARTAVAELIAAVDEQEQRIFAMQPPGSVRPPMGWKGSSTRAGGDLAVGWKSHLRLAATAISLVNSSSVTCLHAFNEAVIHLGLGGGSGSSGGIWASGAGRGHSDSWGPPRVIAVGDSSGRVHFLDAQGKLLYEQYDTGTASPVTTMASYAMRRNESVLVTGHENGEIRTHGVYELLNPVRSTSRGETVISSVFLSHVLPPGRGAVNIDSGFASGQPAATITQLAAFRSMGKLSGKRLVAAWDANGWLRIVKDDGSVRFSAHGNSSLLATRYNGNLLVGLSATRATVLSVGLMGTLRSYECVGLNASHMVAAVFDPVRVYRGYAVTDTGDLLALIVPHDARASACKVAKRIHIFDDVLSAVSGDGDPNGSLSSSPVSPPAINLVALRGHLIFSRGDRVAIINITSMLKEGLDEVVSWSVAELAAVMGAAAGDAEGPPLIAVVGHSNMVAVSLRGANASVLSLFVSTLPVPRGMDSSVPVKAWTQPIFIVIMLVVAVFQFLKARGQRHGSYTTPAAARRLREFEATGGLRPSAASRLGSYQDQVRGLGESAEAMYAARAVRRAARMAPVTRIQQAQIHREDIVEEEEEGEGYDTYQ